MSTSWAGKLESPRCIAPPPLEGGHSPQPPQRLCIAVAPIAAIGGVGNVLRLCGVDSGGSVSAGVPRAALWGIGGGLDLLPLVEGGALSRRVVSRSSIALSFFESFESSASTMRRMARASCKPMSPPPSSPKLPPPPLPPPPLPPPPLPPPPLPPRLPPAARGLPRSSPTSCVSSRTRSPMALTSPARAFDGAAQEA